MREWTLLTGATGFVGSALLRALTAAGLSVAVLIRDQPNASARERYAALAATLPADAVRLVVLVEGDICRPEVVDPWLTGWLSRRCLRVVHAAANVEFSGDPASTNVAGTENMLRLMDRCGIAELHHISTAYQCGIQPGGVVLESEQGNPAGQYRNAYERSKHEAERAVRDAVRIASKTIYRPSIVVGDRQTGATSSFQSFYRIIKFASLAKLTWLVAAGRIGIPLTGSECVNLVPIDWLAESVARIIGNPALHGRAYHLTREFTTGQIASAISEYFGVEAIEFVGSAKLDAPNIIERYLPEYMAEYQGYFGTDPVFDRTNADAAVGPCVTDECFLRNLIDYAVEAKFGRSRGAKGRASRVEGRGPGQEASRSLLATNN